jgi:glyoxylase-like metal-dependent hydrolase (beta-lactamase superfamily II)
MTALDLGNSGKAARVTERVLRWSVGDITVTRIEESVDFTSKSPQVFFPGFDRALFEPHVEWMAPIHYDPKTDQLVSSIHSWIIQTGRHTILLDACAGNHRERPWAPRWHMQEAPYLERIAAANVRLEDVDIVLCTHLHTDHCGWNTMNVDGRWVPTFPNAKYLIHKREHAHWNPESPIHGPRAEQRRQLWTDSVLPVIEAGQVELVEGAYEIEKGVVIVEAHGHTAGLVVLHVENGGRHAVFCSDVIHHPVQICMPDWNTFFCEDPARAKNTRHELIEHTLRHDATLFPAHFAWPHVAAIAEVRAGLMPRFIDARP